MLFLGFSHLKTRKIKLSVYLFPFPDTYGAGNFENIKKQETAEDGKASLSAIWPWKSTNQGQGKSNHRNP